MSVIPIASHRRLSPAERLALAERLAALQSELRDGIYQQVVGVLPANTADRLLLAWREAEAVRTALLATRDP